MMIDNRGKIDINSTDSGEFYFNVIAENGNIISSSKMYDSKELLIKGVDIMRSIFNKEDLNIFGLEDKLEEGGEI
tara:strand:+ start:28781 stop:29005 length:225 start_codon:yes stop_codon:yes gene_type:complete